MDGSLHRTSPIVGIEEDKVVTFSGSRYTLGTPAADYEQQFPNAKARLLESLRKIEREKAVEKPTEQPTADIKEWGDAWVYCNQHLYVHKTGWCSVGIEDKVCLYSGQHTFEEAIMKAKLFGLKLYNPTPTP